MAEELVAVFKALSNAHRVKLLRQLRTPKNASDVRLHLDREDGVGSADRPMSRQAVRKHIQELVGAGLVRELDEGAFVVDHARLFTAIEQARHLNVVNPLVDLSGETRALDESIQPGPRSGPRLVMVRGVTVGAAYGLNLEKGSVFVGRAASSDVRVEHDPHVSARHAEIVKGPEGIWLVRDCGSRNGTSVNWSTLKPEAWAPLASGDVLGFGMTLMVFRSE